MKRGITISAVVVIVVLLAGFMFIASRNDSRYDPPPKVAEPSELAPEPVATKPQGEPRLEPEPLPPVDPDESIPPFPDEPPPEKPGHEEKLAEGEALILQLGARSFRIRRKATKEILRNFHAYKELLKKHKSNPDPEIKSRVAKIIKQEAVQFYQELACSEIAIHGEAKGKEKAWPCIIHFKKYNDFTSRFEGTIEWTTLNATHKIEGTVGKTSFGFTETEFIKKGNAVLQCHYSFELIPYWKLTDRRMNGKWKSSRTSDNGPIWLDLDAFLKKRELPEWE